MTSSASSQRNSAPRSHSSRSLRRLGWFGAACLAAGVVACGSDNGGKQGNLVDGGTGGAGEGGPGSGGKNGTGGASGSAGKGASGASGSTGTGGKSAGPDGGMETPDGGKMPPPATDGGHVKPGQTIVLPGKATEIDIGIGGDPTAVSISVPMGAVTSDTTVTVGGASLPSSAPSTVSQVTPGFQIDLNGQTLKVAAKTKLKLPYNPTNGDLLIVSYSPNGVTFIKYMLEMDGSDTYATFNITQGGRYLAIRLVPKPGCDKTLSMAPSIAKQADVDALSTVRRIVGNLTISGTSITSLAGLKCLQQVDGYIQITNTNVTSTDDLAQLTLVGTDDTYYNYYYGVTFDRNSLLDNVKLPSLVAIGNRATAVNGGMSITSNPVLTSVSADALDAATFVFTGNSAATTGVSFSLKSLIESPQVTITNNPALKDLNGLAALQIVPNDFTLDNGGFTSLDGLKSLEQAKNLNIRNNVSLTSGAGLRNVKTLYALNVSGNQLLENLPLDSLSTVAKGGAISVTNNAALKTFSAGALKQMEGGFTFTQNGNATDATVIDLSALATTSGGIEISQNLGLQALDKFTSLTAAAAISIQNNAALKTISGFANVATAAGVTITNNGKLADLGGLAKLARADFVSITNNDALTSAALPALAALQQYISVTQNGALTSFSADAVKVAPAEVTITSNGAAGTETKLSMASLASATGALTISQNPGVANLDGFAALISAGAGVTISRNDALANVDGLKKLSTITGALDVSYNKTLANVSGLSGLTRVTQGVSITNNAALGTVALPALTSAGGISISTNAALTSAKVDALTGIPGNFTFQSNGTASTVGTTTLSLAAVTTIQAFSVSYNPKLAKLDGFPKLTGVTSYYVVQNVLLPTCQAVNLRTQITSHGSISGGNTISGNLSDGCMP